mmetsp:Transcript_21292/g.25182  ORF Transcript_21292/g.25182 Transcript_21292/m.25182 type:complete len:745 (+) Transcript_21292:77-2311(+)
MEEDLSPQLLKLKLKLARFVLAEKKKEVEKYLERKSKMLMSLPLADNGMEVTLEQAIKDAAREKLVFNDCHYHGGWDELHRLRADVLELATELVASPECTTALSAEALANLVLIKAARTRNGGDAYVRTRLIFEPPGGDWVLKPLDRDTFPIDIKLFPHGKAIFAQVSTMNQYGLYRMEDLMEGDSAVSWLPIDAVVVEQIDLNNDRTHRDLRILASLEGHVRRRFIDRLFFRNRARTTQLASRNSNLPQNGSTGSHVAPVSEPPPKDIHPHIPPTSPSLNRLSLMGAQRYAEDVKETNTVSELEAESELGNAATIQELDKAGDAEEEVTKDLSQQEGEVVTPDLSQSEGVTVDEEDRLANPGSSNTSGLELLEHVNLFKPDGVNDLISWFGGDQPSWFEPPSVDLAVPDWFPSSEETPKKAEERIDEDQKNENSFMEFDWPLKAENDWMFGLFSQQQEEGESNPQSMSGVELESSSGEEDDVESEEDIKDIKEEPAGTAGQQGEERTPALTLSMLLDGEAEDNNEADDGESDDGEADEFGALLASVELSHFHLPLLKVGISSEGHVRNAPDSLLSTSGMRKGHLLKLRRATGEQRSEPEIRLPKDYIETRMAELNHVDSTDRTDRSGSDSIRRRPSKETQSFHHSPNQSPNQVPFSRQRAVTFTSLGKKALAEVEAEDEDPSLPVFPPFKPPQMDLPDSAQRLMAHAPKLNAGIQRGPSFDRSKGRASMPELPTRPQKVTSVH